MPRLTIRLTVAILLILCLLVGLFSLSVSAAPLWWGVVLSVAILTALAVCLGILLTEGEVSFAHAPGIMGFLALESSAFPWLVLAVFGGSLVGGWVLWQRKQQLPRRHPVRRTARSPIIFCARTTLSFVIAGQFYLWLGGSLPIRPILDDQLTTIVLYTSLYTLLYALIYILEIRLEGRNVATILRQNSVPITIALLLPVAYAVLTAIVYVALPTELFVLLLLGFMLSIVLTFAYSRERYLLQQQLTETKLLSEFSRALHANTDMATLMATVETQLPNLLDAQDVLISVAQPGGDRLRHTQLSRDDERIDRSEIDPADDYLIQQLIARQQPTLIPQGVVEHLQRRHIAPHRVPVHAWVGVPMLARGQSIGALVARSAQPHTLDENTQRWLQIVASTLSTTIDNLQLHHQQRGRLDRLSMLNTISVLLSRSLSPSSVLDAVTSSAAMLSDAHAAAVYLGKNAAEAPPQMTRSAGLSDAYQDNPPDLLLRRHQLPKTTKNTDVVDEFLPLVIENVNQDERTRHLRDLLADERVEAIIELPLVSGDVFRGAIVLFFQQTMTFSDEFIEFLRTFTSEVVQSIRNAEMYTRTDEALERRLRQLSILAAVGQQTTASIDLVTISEVVLQHAVEYTQAQRGIIAMSPPMTPSAPLRIMAQRGYDAGESLSAHWLEQGTTGRALQHGEQVYIDRPEAFSGASRLVPTTASQLVVPVLRERTVIGVMVLESDTPAHFGTEEQDFLGQLMTQAAITIDNRSLFSEVTRSRDRLQVILDAMSEGIVLLDKSDEIILANPAVELIGLAQDDLLGQNLRTLVERADGFEVARGLGFDSVADVYHFLDSLGDEPTALHKAVRYTVRDGQQVCSLERQVIPVLDEANDVMTGALLVFYDLSKQAELDRTRNDLMRMLVHDLRSPLTAVTTSMSLIPRLVPPNVERQPEIEEIVATSRRAVRKMLRRVDSLLDVAKMESGEISISPVEFRLEDKVENVFAELQPLAQGRDITLRLAVPEPLPTLCADGDKIERVVQNLVDNALKYTLPETDVTVRIAPKEDATQIRLDVIDSGPGIPLAYKDKLFDRFVQVNGYQAERGGVGLGLTFCQLVVSAHHGSIWVEDNPTGGSIFSFLIPTVYDEDASEPVLADGGLSI